VVALAYGLGVDLGGTFAAAAVRRGSGVTMAALGDRSLVLPSVVFARSGGELVVGDAAARRALVDPSGVAREFRRRLGDPTPIVLAGRPYHPAALMAAQLSQILRSVSQDEDGPPTDVVLTYPAVWGHYRQEQFAEVARLAGIDGARMVTEPAATAARCAATGRLARGGTVLVYDLGGGTLATTVLRVGPDGVEVLGQPEGLENLGGTDLDQAVLGYVDEVLRGEVGRLDPADPRAAVALGRLRRDCMRAKELLSTEPETVVPVYLPDGQRQVTLGRDEFERRITPFVRSTLDAAHRTLGSAGLGPGDLSAVLLAGGCARIPLVARTVADELRCPVHIETHPKHAVALGAATLTYIPGSATDGETAAAAGAGARSRSGAWSGSGLGGGTGPSAVPPPGRPGGGPLGDRLRRTRPAVVAAAVAVVLVAATAAITAAVEGRASRTSDARSAAPADTSTGPVLPPSDTASPPASQANPGAVPAAAQGRIGSWSMGHHQELVIPDDGGGHPATASGGVSWEPGPDGRTPAMHLDGSSGFAQTDAAVLDAGSSYTVEAWVRLDRLPASFSTAVSQDSGDASSFYLQYSTDERRFAMASIDGQPVRATSAEEPKPAVWYQLVGILDIVSGTRSLYVDGVLQMTIRVPPRAPPAPGQLQIGRARYGGNPTDYWPGSIARVTVYQRALSAEDVLVLYHTGP